MTNRRIMKPATDAAKPGARGVEVWAAVGRRLALRRAELGQSADRIAEAAGIRVETYRAYENGAPIPALSLAQIADVLDRAVPWFFEGVARQEALEGDAEPSQQPATYKVATVEHRIQALTESFRQLDFEGQQHLLAISRALSRAGAGE